MRVITRAMPHARRPVESDVFLSGLLHDLGQLALAQIEPAISDEIFQMHAMQPATPIEMFEREMSGISHCELGALLARQWDLPLHIVEVLRHHHDRSGMTGEASLITVIRQAEVVVTGKTRTPAEVDACAEGWETLGIAAERVEELLASLDQAAKDAIAIESAFA